MRHTWRWFGPVDKVTIADARQAGAQGIVTALHHVPYGAVWTSGGNREAQARGRQPPLGRASGLAWEVVESLPVSEAVKTQSEDFRDHIAELQDVARKPRRRRHRHDLLQFHAGARLDAHRSGLAGSPRRHDDALRPRRFRRLRHSCAPETRGGARLLERSRGRRRPALRVDGWQRANKACAHRQCRSPRLASPDAGNPEGAVQPI